MINRLASLIWNGWNWPKDIHIRPTPPTPDIHTGPYRPLEDDQLKPPIEVPPDFMKKGNVRNVPREHEVQRTVRLFGVNMTSVHKDESTETWFDSFDLITVQVKYHSILAFPWSATISGKHQITSHPMQDVLRIEKWAEKVLLRIREQIPAGPPHLIAEQHRRERLRSKIWSPLPHEPLELECFAVKTNDGEHHIIQKAPFPRGEYQWMTKLSSKVTAVWTWDIILSEFSHYYELPPLQ